MTETFRFVVLGDLRFWRSGIEQLLGNRQQQLVLARLLASPGRSVSRGDLAELLWSDRPPARATNLIHRYIGNIRRLIEPGLPRRSLGQWLLSDGHRYRLSAGPDHLDLVDFRRHLGAGRQAAQEGRAGPAMRCYLAALRLWQGRFGAGIEPATGPHPSFDAVDQECVTAVQEVAEVAARIGHARDVLPAVGRAARLNLLDERLHAQWMLLLAADGKQAEAMLRYHDIRRRLIEELGMEPGPELLDAYDQLLHRSGPPSGVLGPSGAVG